MFKEISRDIRSDKKFVFYFILNLSMGLIGLVGLLGFKAAFQNGLNKRSRTILGSDLAVYSRVALTEEKKSDLIKLLPEGTVTKERISMFSMLQFQKKTRLVNIKTMPDGFPFYGKMTFRKNDKNHNQFESGKAIWVYPEISTQLGLNIGDQVTIGEAQFLIENIVDKDPQQTFQMGNLAPRVFLSPEGLKRAKLVQKGSTAFYGIFYKIKDGHDLKALADKVEKSFEEVGPNVVTPDKTGEQTGRFLQYLSDFLGLVSLVALFLSSIGLFYLFRSFIATKKKEMAVYLALGRTRKELLKKYLSFLMFLGVMGTFLGIIVGNLLFISLSGLLNHYFTFKLQFLPDGEFTLLALFIGVTSSFLIGVPLLHKSLNQGASHLFQENPTTLDLKPKLIWFLPWLLFYWFTGIWVSHSIKIGSLFFGLFMLQGILGVLLLLPFFGLLEKLSSRFSLTTKHALLYLSRHKASSMAAFLALAQGVLLLTLIPQIRSGLSQELTDVDGSKTPSLFLFDIQEDQVKPLENFFSSKGLPLEGITPMIRGRITKINDKEFERPKGRALTREEEREFRFRNRGANFTYRSELHSSEKIIEGRPMEKVFDESSGKLPELSIEFRYAKRLGIELGDKVTFDILGMPIDAKVVNKRKVKWTSFHPNFFLVFQPGVLDLAPKTFLGVIGNMSSTMRNEVQVGLFDLFPNVSVIDITRVIDRIILVLEQMSFAMGAMAILSLLAGIFVLFSLINHQLELRTRDAGLFKLLGISSKQLRKILIKEFQFLSLAAAVFGSLGSIMISFGLAWVLFDGLWKPLILLPGLTIITLLVVVYILCWLSSAKIFRTRSRDLIE